MQTFTVQLYAEGTQPLRTEKLVVSDAHQAREWATERLAASQTFTRARIYDDTKLLSEVGYRIIKP
ncbi:MAG TPA: hypothetical protein VLJ13_07140 [Brevundimonas sp.]|nr:hypothetical protein [Brevundimonas sp.]